MDKNKKTKLLLFYLITHAFCFSLTAMVNDDDDNNDQNQQYSHPHKATAKPSPTGTLGSSSSFNNNNSNTSYTPNNSTNISVGNNFLGPLGNLLKTSLPGYSISPQEQQKGNNKKKWKQSLGEYPVDQFRVINTGKAPCVTVGEFAHNNLLPSLLAGALTTLATSKVLTSIPEGRRLARKFGWDPFLVAGAAGALATAWSARTSLNNAWEAQFAAENAMEQIQKDFQILQSTQTQLKELPGLGNSDFILDVLRQSGFRNNEYTAWTATDYSHKLKGTAADVVAHQKLINILKQDQEATLRLRTALENAQHQGFKLQYSNAQETDDTMQQTLEERFKNTGAMLGALGSQQVRPSDAAYTYAMQEQSLAAQKAEGAFGKTLGALPAIIHTAEKLAPFAAIAALLLQSQMQKQQIHA